MGLCLCDRHKPSTRALLSILLNCSTPVAWPSASSRLTYVIVWRWDLFRIKIWFNKCTFTDKKYTQNFTVNSYKNTMLFQTKYSTIKQDQFLLQLHPHNCKVLTIYKGVMNNFYYSVQTCNFNSSSHSTRYENLRKRTKTPGRHLPPSWKVIFTFLKS